MARDRKSRGWLSSLLSGRDDPPGTRYELVVLDGADAGCHYPIDQPQIQIGRRVPGSTSESGIELNDKSVSGRHAIIGWEDGRVTVEHLPSATNPTLVNGRRVTRKRVRDGDRIVLGLVVLELRALRPQVIDARAMDGSPFASPRVATEPVHARAELVLREGIDDLRGARFPLVQRRTSIGRDDDCDISLDVASVSRNHAALVWEHEQLVLIHESAVNPTHVNGMQVRDRRRVFQGDEIRLSERVAFEVLLNASDAAGRAPQAAARVAASEEATHLTSPPAAAAPEVARPVDDADTTRVTPLPVSTAAPEAARPVGDADATRVTPLPVSTEAPEAARPVGDADPTRTATEEDTPDPVAAPPPTAPDERFATGDAAQAAAVPDRSRYADADVTRVAPIPAGAAEAPSAPPTATSPEATRVIEPEVLEPAPEAAADSAKTVIRRSPVADAERTIVRRPRAPVDDAGATVIRPRPGEPGQSRSRGPAETVVFEPESAGEDDETDEEEGR